MNNFTFCNPVKIVFGKGTIAQINDLVPGKAQVMIVYGGGSIKRNGVYEQVTKALGERRFIEFSGIEPNPRYETCMKAVELGRKEGMDFLLAVGGGSVLDATKFIAAAMRYRGRDPWKIVLTRGQVVRSAVALGAVLTLPATGSEMNCIAVISREATQEKLAFVSPKVYPRFSILDPVVTYSLPKKQLRNGLVDIFIHVMEQYATYDVVSPLQDRQAEAIVQTLVELADRILADKPDYDSRASFMWCATMALNSLIGCGVAQDWSTHMIGHELTAFFGLDHAESLAIVMPAVWRHQKHNKLAKLAQLAERLWDVREGNVSEKADAAIEKLVEFFHHLDMPTRLSDYGISGEEVRRVADRFAARGKILGEHNNITHSQVWEILNLCL
jgi:NADP-dependent alcohol dehydrogenase